jgi:hypothetical protein
VKFFSLKKNIYLKRFYQTHPESILYINQLSGGNHTNPKILVLVQGPTTSALSSGKKLYKRKKGLKGFTGEI